MDAKSVKCCTWRHVESKDPGNDHQKQIEMINPVLFGTCLIGSPATGLYQRTPLPCSFKNLILKPFVLQKLDLLVKMIDAPAIMFIIWIDFNILITLPMIVCSKNSGRWTGLIH